MPKPISETKEFITRRVTQKLDVLNLHNTKPMPGVWILIVYQYRRKYREHLSRLGLAIGELMESIDRDTGWYKVEKKEDA